MNTSNEYADNWMLTHSGIAAHPWAPSEDEICIEDIAHALSLLCRFGGHCREFYSVAQHSVLVSNVLPMEFAFEGLMHDATEAYCGDVIRDVKVGLSDYRGLESGLRRVIAAKFKLKPEIPDAVKIADNRALATEKRDLLPKTGAGVIPWLIETAGFAPYPCKIYPLTAESAEQRFLDLFYSLRQTT